MIGLRKLARLLRGQTPVDRVTARYRKIFRQAKLAATIHDPGLWTPRHLLVYVRVNVPDATLEEVSNVVFDLEEDGFCKWVGNLRSGHKTMQLFKKTHNAE